MIRFTIGRQSIRLLAAFMLLGGSVVGSGPRAQADDSVANFRAEVAATVQLDAAELAKSRFELRNLQQLYERGHASWLELETARTGVRCLESLQDAHRKLLDEVDRLRRNLAARPSDGGPTTREPSLPALRCALPGSVRLVAWLELAESSPEDIAVWLAHLSHEINAVEVDQQVQAARDELAETSQKKNPHPASPRARREAERAKLTSAIAQAHLQLALARLSSQNAERSRLQQLAERFPIADLTATPAWFHQFVSSAAAQPHVTHASSPDLQELTQKIARGESENSGALAAAQVTVRQCVQKAENLKQLAAKGAAAKSEVQAAAQLLAQVTEDLQGIRDRQMVIAAYDSKLQRKTPIVLVSGCPLQPSGVFSPETSRQNAAALLDDSEGLRHLLELRAECADSAARRGAAQATLELRLKILGRLKASFADREATSNGSPQALQRASQELENEELQVAYFRAQLLTEEERLAALRLEEARFCEQRLQQRWAPRPTLTSRMPAEHPYPGALEEARLAGSRAISYIESADVLHRSDRYELRQRIEERLATSRPEPLYRYWPRYARYGYCAPLTVFSRRSAFQWYASPGAGPQTPLACLDVRTPLASPSRFRSDIPWYSDYYAMGIRRADPGVRSPFGRGNAYGGPWYFPGAPTNYIRDRHSSR